MITYNMCNLWSNKKSYPRIVTKYSLTGPLHLFTYIFDDIILSHWYHLQRVHSHLMIRS